MWYINHNMKLGIICGFIVALYMRIVPLFHGYDSNDVKRIVFTDKDNKQYKLITERIDCK